MFSIKIQLPSKGLIVYFVACILQKFYVAIQYMTIMNAFRFLHLHTDRFVKMPPVAVDRLYLVHSISQRTDKRKSTIY